MRIGEDLLKRVNSVAQVLQKSQTDFIKQTLDEKTRYYEAKYKTELNEIAKFKQKILEREKASRR